MKQALMVAVLFVVSVFSLVEAKESTVLKSGNGKTIVILLEYDLDSACAYIAFNELKHFVGEYGYLEKISGAEADSLLNRPKIATDNTFYISIDAKDDLLNVAWSVCSTGASNLLDSAMRSIGDDLKNIQTAQAASVTATTMQ
jgi:hypothetical protein